MYPIILVVLEGYVHECIGHGLDLLYGNFGVVFFNELLLAVLGVCVVNNCEV